MHKHCEWSYFTLGSGHKRLGVWGKKNGIYHVCYMRLGTLAVTLRWHVFTYISSDLMFNEHRLGLCF